MDAVIGTMTTNETSFFRDMKPFQNLRQTILTGLMKARAQTKRIRIWSAASSTGQEAYSIAMVVRECLEKIPDWHFEIVGTDIADHVLQQASSGCYNNFEIQRGLSMSAILHNFRQTPEGWVVHDDLRRMVKFHKFNLLDNPARLGTFDVVFCRNVLIYFNADRKLQVLKGLHSVLPDDGYLLLGSCENAFTDRSQFAPVAEMHGVYTRQNRAHSVAAARF